MSVLSDLREDVLIGYLLNSDEFQKALYLTSSLDYT